jgi:capsular polysaccharide biosynthesis protein
MPRLFLSKDLLLNNNCTLLVDEYTFNRGKELFTLMKIKSIKVVPKNQLVLCFKIYYCNIITPNVGSFHSNTLNAMKEYIFESLKLRHGSSSHRFYISRAKAASRKILNEDELKPILYFFGFKIVYAEDLNMFDQIKLFKNASVIMGMHGSGLSNIFYKIHLTFAEQIVQHPYYLKTIN